MNKFRLAINVLAVVIFTLAFASSAQAQATRTWVSGVGDDANPCSRTAPCKTFAGAISKTATGGEINCLDPGGFGGVTITKAISIICEVGTAGVLVSGTNAIIVNVPTRATKSSLKGSTSKAWEQVSTESISSPEEGSLFAGASSGISAGNGVNLVGSLAGARAYIIDSLIVNNNGGVNVSGRGQLRNARQHHRRLEHVLRRAGYQRRQQDHVEQELAYRQPGCHQRDHWRPVVVSIGPSNFLTGTGAPTSTVPFQ